MSNNDFKTAEELMAELERDPEYLRRRMERDEKFRQLKARYTELARPILVQLRDKGFEAESIEHLVKKYAPLPSEVVSIILEHLEHSRDERHGESLVRALGAASRPFDGTGLSRMYDSTSDESLRWAIANTIALTHPHSIDEWIASASDESALKKTLPKLGYFW